MQRCLWLSELGAGEVAPNPMVGAILVDTNGIIKGEGFHEQFGQAHAEVNAIRQALIDSSDLSSYTLYVSLEPCSHHGKTPPCTDLIIHHRIRKVVIGCRDPFPEVNGKGIAKLKAAGIEVVENVLMEECMRLNKRFFTSHIQKRPYVLLKWAQTADGFMSGGPNLSKGQRLMISNDYTNRLVHKWRSEEAAIMVGTNTVLEDNPLLTTRLWPGSSPLRVTVDLNERIPPQAAILNNDAFTLIFSYRNKGPGNKVQYSRIEKERPIIPQILEALNAKYIQSIMIEGGPHLLGSFIKDQLWDEARIITSQQSQTNGQASPKLGNAILMKQENIDTDMISYYRNPITLAAQS